MQTNAFTSASTAGTCERCGAASAPKLCVACRQKAVNSHPVAHRRAMATRYRADFIGTCAIHGEALHSWRHGHCLTCFTQTGAPRRHNWRAEARAAGKRTGLNFCAVHGRRTPHSVKHYGCLLCFTAHGTPRSPGRPVTWFSGAADEIAQRRGHLALSVETFAPMVGVTPAQLIAWESGHGGEPTSLALDVARALTPDLVVLS